MHVYLPGTLAKEGCWMCNRSSNYLFRCGGSFSASTGLSRENSEHEKNPAKKSRKKSSADGKRLNNTSWNKKKIKNTVGHLL